VFTQRFSEQVYNKVEKQHIYAEESSQRSFEDRAKRVSKWCGSADYIEGCTRIRGEHDSQHSSAVPNTLWM